MRAKGRGRDGMGNVCELRWGGKEDGAWCTPHLSSSLADTGTV